MYRTVPLPGSMRTGAASANPSSQISVGSGSPCSSLPPATSTRPSVSKVALWDARKTAPASGNRENTPLAGSKISAAVTSAPPLRPPMRSTVPSDSSVAVCHARGATMLFAVGAATPVSGSHSQVPASAPSPPTIKMRPSARRVAVAPRAACGAAVCRPGACRAGPEPVPLEASVVKSANPVARAHRRIIVGSVSTMGC